MAIDSGGNVYVVGNTSSIDFPITAGAFDISYNGSTDAFVSKLNGDLDLLASTYLGGHSNDYAKSVAINSSGKIYVVGSTNSSNFPTTFGAYDTSNEGDYDVFVSKFDSDLSAATPTPTASPIPTVPPMPTASSTPTPIPCEAENIEAFPKTLKLKKEESDTVTVTVLCEDSSPVVGETVTTKIKSGKKRISVSPQNIVTTASGQAIFTVTATNKTGNAKVKFETTNGLKTSVTVKVRGK